MKKILFSFLVIISINEIRAQSDTSLVRELNRKSEEISKQNADSSLALAKQALAIAEKINYKRGRATSKKNIAISYYVNGKTDEAIKIFIDAIRLFEDLKDINELAHCYSQMGICFYLQYQYENALKYYDKSISLYLQSKNLKDLAGVYINQGISYTYVNKMQEAEANYNKALKIYQDINYEPGFAPAYNSLAKIYFAKKDYKTAIDYYLLATSYSLKSENKYYLISNYNSLATCFKETKQFQKAKEYSQKSIEISEEVGALEREYFCHETMAEIQYAMGDYKGAYESMLKYNSLKDTLFNQDKNDAIAEMQAKFDVEKNQQKVKEIELQKKLDDEAHTKQLITLTVIIIITLLILFLGLIFFRNKQKINQLLKQKNQAIQANLEQKETMMSEIHHRVKNNLQMVSSILDLQARELSDTNSIRVIEDSLNRINAICLIHQRLYQTDNIRGIKIDSYLKELCNDLIHNFSSKSNAEIVTRYAIDTLILDLETAIPIGLISAELVTNACKYAFKNCQRPVLSIELKQENNKLILTIADNGIGKSNQSDAGTSFGTKLIKSLSRKLKAEIKEEVSNGTRITLIIHQFKLYES